MIPDSAGATPYGIFILADDFLGAARLVMGAPGRRAAGPVRLLAYHSAELFLKTYMRSAGETIVVLRAQGHDLVEMIERSKSLGLKLPAPILAHARKATKTNDYVRVRYVTQDRPDISLESFLQFAEAIRTSVIAALDLNEYGVPRGRHWLGEPPPDYPGVVKG
jgi:hypothetical protein